MTLSEAEIVAEKKVATEEPTPPVDSTVGEGIALGKEFTPLYEQFDVKNPDSRIDSILEKIWDYAKTVSNGKDQDSIIFEIIRLKHRLGSPSLGEPAWGKIFNYVNVWQQFRTAGERLKELDG